MRLEASLSLPSPRWPHNESISSMKIMEGALSRAIWNKFETSFSLSPIHFETRSEEEILKKVESASVATAFARYDFPVPGGPYSRKALHGRRFPIQNCGNLTGNITASCNACLALSSPATSFHLILGFSLTIAEFSPALNFELSESSPSPPPPPFFGFVFGRAATAASPFAAGPLPPPSSRTARISSALLKYSVNFWVIASLTFGFFSYFK
nr:cell division control protein 48 [Ipomoea batatas]